LKENGYRTVCATANPLISFETGLARGFDEYVTRRALGSRGRKLRRAKYLLLGGDTGGGMLNGWLREHVPGGPEPLFLFVNYQECHWPYAPRRRFQRRVQGPRFGFLEGLRYRMGTVRRAGPWETIATADTRTLEILSTLYDAELANVDRHVADLLELLHERRRLKDRESVLIITSDHGEHIGEHGLAEHQASVDDHLVRVPFVVWGPGRIPAGSRVGMYEFVDVFPSLCQMLGQQVPSTYLEGRRADLLARDSALDADGVAFGEWRSWGDEKLAMLSSKNPSYDLSSLQRDLIFARDRRFKLVRAGSQEAMYDLESDPAEETDVAPSHPEIARRLRDQLDRAIATWRPWEDEDAALTQREAEEIEEHLSALGYI
jgi:arylsulfatase A-like enzyme